MGTNEVEIVKIQEQLKYIKEFIDKFANLHDTIASIKLQVQGGKDFRDAFEDNVSKVVSNILNDSHNLKTLEDLTNGQISKYVNTAEFERELKKFIVSEILAELEKSKSDINLVVKDIIEDVLKEKERKIFIRLLTWVFGSSLVGLLTVMATVYSMFNGG